jgi:hypothetical protein
MEDKSVCAYKKTDDRTSGSGETKRKEGYRLSELVIPREERKGKKSEDRKEKREKKKKEGGGGGVNEIERR